MREVGIALSILCFGFFLTTGVIYLIRKPLIKNKPETTLIVSAGGDTIKIVGHYNIQHLGTPCGVHGHNDTLTGIETITFEPCDDIRVTGIGIEEDTDTIFVTTPIYIDSTTVKGKRILKLKK